MAELDECEMELATQLSRANDDQLPRIECAMVTIECVRERVMSRGAECVPLSDGRPLQLYDSSNSDYSDQASDRACFIRSIVGPIPEDATLMFDGLDDIRALTVVGDIPQSVGESGVCFHVPVSDKHAASVSDKTMRRRLHRSLLGTSAHFPISYRPVGEFDEESDILSVKLKAANARSAINGEVVLNSKRHGVLPSFLVLLAMLAGAGADDVHLFD